ncbi:unnamed protein product [Vitrella brassicaformis CCMP3155]|uniref:Cilia- and flagella-associated protein 91 n=1 Tax=Vitrella brassicaformis (strain CCMP3155) TaxID=1169540 RepID=A0A0G4GVR2_VITBC|nr:unnamed protein product [Vitrella brassicaformis CCMP3155]|eukprot:CEM35011.1 unnamed protein product [Vitrella brassicaformis CCMP3155]
MATRTTTVVAPASPLQQGPTVGAGQGTQAGRVPYRTHQVPNRAYDHLYDPLYCSAGPTDHAKLTMRGMAGQVEKVADCEFYFSELQHCPRHTLRISENPSKAPPGHVDTNWHPPAGPDVDADQVTGKHRHKFFRRPLVASLSAQSPVVYASAAPARVAAVLRATADITAIPRQRAPVDPFVTVGRESLDGRTRTIGIQSVYREGSAQTDPYSPPYVLQSADPNFNPEVLTIAQLCWDKGLPATNIEVAMIQKMRQKRLWDQMLPPSTDEFSFRLRERLLTEAEFKEWADREQHIKDLQRRRLEIIREELAAREEKRTSQQADRVERIRVKKIDNKDRRIAKGQKKRIKTLRKMYREKAMAETLLQSRKRDVIKDYAATGSTVYAPILREGQRPDTATGKIEIQPADLQSFSGLSDLERTMPRSALSVKVPSRDPEINTTKYRQRKDAELEHALESTMSSIKQKLADKFQGEGELLPGERVEGAVSQKKYHTRDILERPETPRVDEVLPEEEKLETATILLQRLIRGRALQNRMFEGKEKRLDLINELRDAERLVEMPPEDQERMQAEKERERAADAVVDSIQGSVVAQTLDQLSKELRRFEEEQRIAAFVKMAERDRRLRQAQESGRRQAEERLRAREDEMFREILGVHQGTVDSYVDQILTSTVEKSARVQALTEAKLKATKINTVVDALEEKYSAPETIVRELVSSFVLPHVHRETVRRRIMVEEGRYMKAAREAVEETVKRVEQAMTKRKEDIRKTMQE